MQVGTLAIQHLFEKDVIYLVPLYQRPYVWSEDEQWQPLWEDLRRLAEALAAGTQPRAHFLGATVQDHPPGPPGHIETRLLIDGQQRLTSIQLCLKAFMDVAGREEDERYRRAIEKMVRNNHPLSTQAYEAFKVWPTNADRDDFEAVMESADRKSLLQSYGARASAGGVGRTIPDAYLFFHQAISDWLEEPDGAPRETKIAALYSALRDNVRLVVIDLDEKDDAQLIFETLNARGTPLLAADLVKNSLLNELQDEGENVEKAYTRYWKPFDSDANFWRDEIGRGHAKRARIELFLQYVLTLMTGDEISAGHLYTAYRDFAAGEMAGTPMQRLQALRRFGGIYKSLQDGHANPEVQQFFDRLNTMDISTAYPFLLRLFDVIGDREELILEVLNDVESFLVRRMVCRLSTRGYNRLFIELARKLDAEPEEIPAKVRTALLAGTAEFDRWPGEDEFAKAWTENPLYENLTRPRLRMLLEAMERGLRHRFAETQSVPAKLTVEHVMPQSWEAYWKLPEGENEAEAAARRNDLIHTIGNLTLLNGKLNPAQSNKPWTDGGNPDEGKREALREYSVLYLNKELCDHESWDEDAIEARAKALLQIAEAAWPRP